MKVKIEIIDGYTLTKKAVNTNVFTAQIYLDLLEQLNKDYEN